jgi:hypothetical protein
MHASHVDAFAHELFTYEPSHVVGADTRDEAYRQTEPRRRNRRIGRTSADIFRERAHIFQPAADLFAIKVNARAADGDQIDGFIGDWQDFTRFVPC